LWKCDDVSEEPTASIVSTVIVKAAILILLPDYAVTRHRKIQIRCRDNLRTNRYNLLKICILHTVYFICIYLFGLLYHRNVHLDQMEWEGVGMRLIVDFMLPGLLRE
jgi:hypothetical protein